VSLEDLGGAGVTGPVNSALVNRLVMPEFEKLSPRERKRMLAAVLVWFFVLTPAAGYGILRLLIRWAELRAGSVGASSIALVAGWADLFVPAGFLAFFITGILLSLLLEWSKWKASTGKFWLVLCMLSFVALSGFCAVAMADWYVVLAPDHVIYNPFLSVTERAYWYDQARSIRSAPERIDELGGTASTGREYLVCFSDGYLWGTMWHPGIFPEEERTRLAQRIAELSGVAIVEMKIFERKDHSCPVVERKR
jgi:hypothetical protein